MKTYEPDFWLAFETGGCGECDRELVAMASHALPIDDDDQDVRFLVGVAWAFHAEHPGRRLVSVNDLSRWLAVVGLDWERLDIDLPDVLVRLSPTPRCNAGEKHASPSWRRVLRRRTR